MQSKVASFPGHSRFFVVSRTRKTTKNWEWSGNKATVRHVSVSIITDEKPKLKDAFKDLLSLAHEWKSIGILLGLPKHVLDRIKTDEEGVRNRLQEMLSEWLKQVDPPPTWAALADAVEHIDRLKANTIRTRFSS